MKNLQLRLFYVSQGLAFSYFWLAIAIPYLLYRGLSTQEVFSLMAIYQYMGVFLEYPTGVIGDRFGYRKVLFVANTFNFLSMLVMAMSGGYYLYLFALLLLAIGSGFSSGNDMGLLKSVSSSVKKDTANYNSLMDFVLFVSSILGGFISQISYEFALITSGFCMFAANIPLNFLKSHNEQVMITTPLHEVVKQGFGSLKNVQLRQLFIFVALFGGFSFTIKNIFGSFGTIYGIDVSQIGIIIGLGGLTRSMGSKIYAEYQKLNAFVVSLFVIFSLLFMSVFPSYVVVVGLMMFNQLLFGYILSKIDGDLQDLASDTVRASLFSLKRLVMRLVSASYLIVYGIAVGADKFALCMFATGLVLLIGVLYVKKYVVAQSAATGALQ